MVSIAYFSMPGAPGNYFTCSTMKATLAQHRCASMYREAKAIKSREARPIEKCIGCDIGAHHAGEAPPSKLALVIGGMTCARCHQPSSRLVCSGICVSCFNRQLEIKKGRNAKGAPPRPIDRFWDDEPPDTKVLVLHDVTMTIRVGSAVAAQVVRGVADMLEGVLRSTRACTDAVSIGMRSPLLDAMLPVAGLVAADRPSPRCSSRVTP